MKSINFDYSLLIKKLNQFQPKELDIPELKKSAILILIYPKDNSFQILMTARSRKLNHHRGEMSFPGGKFDPSTDDTLKDTALRETYEEIGIQKEDIEILGNLDDFPTFTGYTIRPFIGVIKNPENIDFKINHSEVSDLVKIPIDFLVRENLFTEIPFSNRSGKKIFVLSFNFIDSLTKKQFTIWGASAHILTRFLKRIYDLKVTSDKYHRPSLNVIKEFQNDKNIKKI